MKFGTYIEKTRETAVYPENYERDYVIHGLVDELGELKETVESGSLDGHHVERVCSEMGDVMWYLARLTDHFGFDLEANDILREPMDHEVGRGLIDDALVYAARINGHQKKSVRDDADRRAQIQNTANAIFVKLSEAAHHLGLYDIEVVMERNIIKLFDRKERDVLHGDGDDR